VKFYHYTSYSKVHAILEEGLKPFNEEDGNFTGGDDYLFPVSCPPASGVVWLTTRADAPEFFWSGRARLTVNLAPNSRCLHHWETWLRRHEPDFLRRCERGEIDRDSWREHWFYRGVISPRRFVELEADDPASVCEEPLLRRVSDVEIFRKLMEDSED
jgi:hypothetical protein